MLNVVRAWLLVSLFFLISSKLFFVDAATTTHRCVKALGAVDYVRVAASKVGPTKKSARSVTTQFVNDLMTGRVLISINDPRIDEVEAEIIKIGLLEPAVIKLAPDFTVRTSDSLITQHQNKNLWRAMRLKFEVRFKSKIIREDWFFNVEFGEREKNKFIGREIESVPAKIEVVAVTR